LNGDGKLDLLCGLLVAYGNGDGTFAAAVPVSFLSSGFVTSYVADLNGDGKTDILAVNAISGNPFVGDPVQFAVTVFLNQGAGSFTSAGTFPVTPSTSGQFVEVSFLAPTFAQAALLPGASTPGGLRVAECSLSQIFRRDLNLNSIQVSLGHVDFSLPKSSKHMGSAIRLRG
jgi:hypothetical protein